MDKISIKFRKHIGFAVLAILFLLVSIVTFVTDTSRHVTNKSATLAYLVNNHTLIMFFLIVIATGFGFFWSNLSYVELEKQKKGSKQILDIIIMFLNKEEKEIITYLVKEKGETNQAEIARLPGLNNVKAYRSVQKMQEKRLIEVQAHGKVRKVILKDNIYDILKDD
jgi:hypothetical protein